MPALKREPRQSITVEYKREYNVPFVIKGLGGAGDEICLCEEYAKKLLNELLNAFNKKENEGI